MLHAESRAVSLCGVLGACVAIALCAVLVTKSVAQSATEAQPQARRAVDSNNASPIYGVTVPAGYRNWKLISVNHLVTDKVNQVRAQLGNDIAYKAFQDGTLPFPDGSIIAALHWNHVASEENDKVLVAAFPGAQSFVAGPPANVQFMVKDSKKYAATGGWGFGDFKNGKPGDRALHEACFPCHEPAKDRDFVFAHYARAP